MTRCCATPSDSSLLSLWATRLDDCVCSNAAIAQLHSSSTHFRGPQIQKLSGCYCIICYHDSTCYRHQWRKMGRLHHYSLDTIGSCIPENVAFHQINAMIIRDTNHIAGASFYSHHPDAITEIRPLWCSHMPVFPSADPFAIDP